MNFKKMCCFVPLKLKTNIMYSLDQPFLTDTLCPRCICLELLSYTNILLNGVSR